MDPNAGRLPLAKWIEQLQEFHGAGAFRPEFARDWEDAFPADSSGAVTRRNVEDLERRLSQLAERVQALEQR